jgi:hypothetical protein
LEHHTQHGEYCRLKLEVGAMGVTVGSKGEAPRRKDLLEEKTTYYY